MPDMLVKLYELPDMVPLLADLQASGIEVRRAIAPEKHIVVEWVRQNFSVAWASECEVAFANQPVSCFIAVQNSALVGFACHDATCRNFFGPTGVLSDLRGRGVGKALLLTCLHAMAHQGYAYAIIGGAGPVDFYVKSVGAIAIEGSSPGIYRGLLKE
ncbi:MAG TPA: GNAT family N-acetyltransferase [Abditibacteriaceae bacterium]|nr:GNAT family N-acetyltransferase [Abditibacteriaceae bacterium]